MYLASAGHCSFRVSFRHQDVVRPWWRGGVTATHQPRVTGSRLLAASGVPGGRRCERSRRAGPMTEGLGIQPGRAPELTDRHAERRILDRFVERVRRGEGHALVVHGEPGVGKTVLLEYLAGRAAGFRVARAAGVQSEMELAFAG